MYKVFQNRGFLPAIVDRLSIEFHRVSVHDVESYKGAKRP